ncbi:hypothetical protein IWQ57_005073 [Coemansia nantahalensis]|uniref:Uncharacterized protein n=1 Tax=Coemansia nantahalensis TaxID=2789366 RepID=A0ACC1JP63_9FUNG|nr:hypothetical protein IWQ57_005073 [Coemansia nantahalensis]
MDDSSMRGRGRAAQSSVAALEAKNAAGAGGRTEGSERWRRVGARVLPVFTGERLQGTVEEGTEVVRSCLRSSDSLDGVWAEIHAILRVGMASLVRIVYRQVGVAPRYDGPRVKMPAAAALVAECARPDGVADALASVWELVAAHVLPYVEGVFLPLVQFGVASYSGPNSVRGAVLLHFRDALVVPLLPALDDAARTRPPCLPALLHMLSVLAALTPADRAGPVYTAARALAAVHQVA